MNRRSRLLLTGAFSMVSLFSFQSNLQAQKFTQQDTLRGSIGPGRLGWDVLKYDISVEPDYASKTIVGKNAVTYYDNGVKQMQIDLQEPMILDSVIGNGRSYPVTRNGNAWFTNIRDPKAMYKIKPGVAHLTFYFHGKPREAVRPPWDGGWIWKKDSLNNPWMSVACQGLGASVWYPCKDVQSDEPDSGAVLRITVADTLQAIGNGRLVAKTPGGNGKITWIWEVKNPINNYNIVPYIGKYVHFGETYNGLKGPLTMDYWVLDYNLERAKTQFKDATRMMKAFEYWFGPYPFYEDGYKLVEAPHLGMEHQSAVAYGNHFMNGYRGRDLSGTGWGNKWDFIIVHESGHEWFANNITSKDIADMWIHEGFTNYSETLFTDYYYGTKAGNEYLIGTRKGIANDKPIIGPYGVNTEGSGDMYPKSGNMLHTIRQLVGNDQKFRKLLQGLNKTFYHQTVTTQQVEQYMIDKTKLNLAGIFDQYLRTTKVPVLEYSISNGILKYRYTNIVDGFVLPLKTNLAGVKWLKPTANWQQVKAKFKDQATTLEIDPNFYVNLKKVD